MTLTVGGRLGSYEVTAAIGAGGMGEVFRARDTKLNRDVAIKVLPSAFAQDDERLARFKREAQVLASLNHPNIAAIYGLEESGGPGPGPYGSDEGAGARHASPGPIVALILELVEGEDLANRLGRGALPVDEAIAIAKQIADGLEEAHERSIIHRDLKPANIKVTPDGKVKILDFGLAKAFDAESAANPGSSQISQSPTMSRHMTEAGMILGTAAYMSPEQARGKPVDKRTDIWAFGVVLSLLPVRRGGARTGDDGRAGCRQRRLVAPTTLRPSPSPVGIQPIVVRRLRPWPPFPCQRPGAPHRTAGHHGRTELDGGPWRTALGSPWSLDPDSARPRSPARSARAGWAKYSARATRS